MSSLDLTIADNIAWQPQVTRAKATLPSTAQTSEPSSGQPIPGASEIAAAARRPAALPLSARGLLGLVVATVLAIEGLLFAVKGYLPTSAGADTSAGKPARTSAASATAGMADARLFDTLQTAAASPRGVATKENNPEKLLAIADAHLHGSSGVRDVEEGAYWLRRYVAASLGEERMLRALTQLGSTYAEPVSGAPDYIRARQLWEFASQFGDPVAMCFLGALHEHGLGVQPEKKAALHWYARAKSAGGCPQLEESIARVMP